MGSDGGGNLTRGDERGLTLYLDTSRHFRHLLSPSYLTLSLPVCGMVGGEVTGSDGGSNVVTGGDGRVLPLFPVTVSHLLSPPYRPTPPSLRPTEEQESSCLLFLLSPSDPLPSLSNTLPVSLPSFSFSRRATRERKKEKESRKGKGKEEISLFLSFPL